MTLHTTAPAVPLPRPAGEGLRASLRGGVSFPGDADWDVARLAWNLAVDQRPAAVVSAATAADVATTIRWAQAQGLRVAPQGTGHNAGPLDLDGTVLLRTSSVRSVEVDPEQRVARVEAGAIWADVTAAAAAHGLAALAGSAADVGVVGYCVGGGLSWLGRRYGLACNSVRSFEVVTADGEAQRVDAGTEPELFWALRGGGGSYAIVTAVELELFEVGEVYAAALFWPVERAGEVLHAYRRWTQGLPDSVTSCGRLLQIPPLPDVPEPLRGRAFVVVEAVVLAGEEEAGNVLGALRALGPELDTGAVVPVEALQMLHMDPPGPVPGAGDGWLLAELPSDAVDALVAAAGAGSGSPLLAVDLRHLGGALGVSSPGAGAADVLDGEFAVFAVGIAPDAGARAKVMGHIDVVAERLAPWRAERAFRNFAETPRPAAAFDGEETLARLRRVKAAYDPQGLIVANHPVER